jgi:hypothetical protein
MILPTNIGEAWRRVLAFRPDPPASQALGARSAA